MLCYVIQWWGLKDVIIRNFHQLYAAKSKGLVRKGVAEPKQEDDGESQFELFKASLYALYSLESREN